MWSSKKFGCVKILKNDCMIICLKNFYFIEILINLVV